MAESALWSEVEEAETGVSSNNSVHDTASIWRSDEALPSDPSIKDMSEGADGANSRSYTISYVKAAVDQ